MVTVPDKPIVLLGFMGSGKSTLGKQLATAIGWSFLDLDRFIEAEENRLITEIFERSGEASFRLIESKALLKVLKYPRQVIAIGGGTPCQTGNMQIIKENSQSVYLKVSPLQLLHRLSFSTTPRPLLKGKTEPETLSLIEEMMVNREPYYSQADIIIESDAITARSILSQIEWLTRDEG